MKKYSILFAIALSGSMAASAQVKTAQNVPTDSITLREVVVTATHPLERIEGDGIVTTVQGTALSRLGMAKDVLGFIPGIINNNGQIEVFGKGTPVLYINGRRQRNNILLEQLTADKIKDITLITNPGARYGSDANAIIRITTVKNPGEGFALDTRTTVGYHDYVYGKEQATMNYRVGGADIFATLEYDHTRTKGFSMNQQNTWLEQHSLTTLTMNSKNRSQLLEGQVGFNYTTNSGDSYGIYYQTLSKPVRTDSHTASTWAVNNVEEDNSQLSQQKHTDYYEHLADAYYSGTWGRWTADATFDFLWKNNREKQTIHPLEDAATLPLQDNSYGRMFAGEIHLSHPLWKGRLNIGAEYTDSRRKDDFSTEVTGIADNNNHIEETNVGLYSEMAQRFGRLNVQLGLRYEHTDANYFEYGLKIPEQSRTYDYVLPSVTLVFPVKQAVFQLGYSRKYIRPLYAQLSNTVNYVNQYIYETGNPQLKTPLNDNVSLNIKYKWLMFMATYKHVTDPIITTCTSYADNPAITLLKKDNSSHNLDNLQVMLSAAPGFIGKFYYPTLACGMVAQHYKVAYRDNILNLNHPMMIFQANNLFRLPDNYMLTANLRWKSRGDGENIRMSQSWQIDLSASKVFNSHWNVKLSLNDVFNTARKTDFTMYSDVRDVHIAKHQNTRYVELNISYKFNMPKSRYKGQGAGNTEKERL